MNGAKKNEKKLKVGLLKAAEQLIKKKQWHCEKKAPDRVLFSYFFYREIFGILWSLLIILIFR